MLSIFIESRLSLDIKGIPGISSIIKAWIYPNHAGKGSIDRETFLLCPANLTISENVYTLGPARS